LIDEEIWEHEIKGGGEGGHRVKIVELRHTFILTGKLQERKQLGRPRNKQITSIAT
jgi:hypothetical protein